jgi:thiamine transport system substrate-binding protein
MRPNRTLAATLCAVFAATSTFAEDKPVLTVMTYDSFASDWGPGPAIETGFEAVCGCDLRFVTGGDGAALLARLRLEGKRTDTDVVVGLDTALVSAAAETGLFAQHGAVATDMPVVWDDPTFIPYDWGWFAFVYDKTRMAAPPDSFRALAASDLRIVIQDPRSSTPGLGLLYWVKAAYGDAAEGIWQGLSDNIVTVTKGWTEAYNLFLDGEADMVLSYTTSPAYHLIAEGDDSKAAAAFTEGHYLQIELAAKVASTDQPALADSFLDFLIGPEAQAAIPTTNWMYPAVTPAGGLPNGFETLTVPKKSLLFPPDEAAAIRDKALDEWRAALSR